MPTDFKSLDYFMDVVFVNSAGEKVKAQVELGELTYLKDKKEFHGHFFNDQYTINAKLDYVSGEHLVKLLNIDDEKIKQLIKIKNRTKNKRIKKKLNDRILKLALGKLIV